MGQLKSLEGFAQKNLFLSGMERIFNVFLSVSDGAEQEGLPPLKGHSLSWSCDNERAKNHSRIKTTQTWQPEDPVNNVKSELFC